jgi:hypothetical protein
MADMVACHHRGTVVDDAPGGGLEQRTLCPMVVPRRTTACSVYPAGIAANLRDGCEPFHLQHRGRKIFGRLSDQGWANEAVWEGTEARPHKFPCLTW